MGPSFLRPSGGIRDRSDFATLVGRVRSCPSKNARVVIQGMLTKTLCSSESQSPHYSSYSRSSDSVSEAEDDRALERERLRRVSIAQLIRNCAIKASSAASPARESSPTLSPSELCPPSLVRDKQSKKKTKKKEEENTVTITKTKTSRSKETRQQFNRRRSIEHMLRGSATSKKKSPASDSSPNDVSAAKATGREAEKLRRYARRRAKMQQSNVRAMHVAALPQKGPRLAHISAKSKSESDDERKAKAKVKAKAKLTSTSMASLSMTKGPQSSSDAELLHDSDRRVRIRSSSIPGVAGPGLDALLPTVVLLDKNAFSLTITAMLLDRCAFVLFFIHLSSL